MDKDRVRDTSTDKQVRIRERKIYSMENVLVSIVVPVYNVEKYLDKCLKSIINQDYKKLQIILVDDGSTDQSGDLCDRWSKLDNRIKTIHKKNGGLVSARKVGIIEAFGEYVCPIDSDDWIEPNMISSLLKIAINEKCDMVTSIPFGTHDKITEFDYQVGKYNLHINEKNFFDYLIYNREGKLGNLLTASVWGKIYKTDIMKEVQLLVDERITFGEDNACVWNYLLNCNSIYLTDKEYYHYNMRKGSISTTKDDMTVARFNYLYNYLSECFSKSNFSGTLMKQLDTYIIESRYWPFFQKKFHELFSTFYTIPYEIIPYKSRILLYGAGKVGNSFYYQLLDSEFCELIGWCDKIVCNEKVKPISSFDYSSYDYVLIAVNDERVKEEIKSDLIDNKIELSKIIWKKPVIHRNIFVINH